MPEDLALPADESLTLAQELLDDGRAFHAHEVLEGTWKAAPEAERELWRGMAQLAVGITHAQRGNATGAARLLRRAAERVEPYEKQLPHRIDVVALVAWARALADRIDSTGAENVGADSLVPRLRSPT